MRAQRTPFPVELSSRDPRTMKGRNKLNSIQFITSKKHSRMYGDMLFYTGERVYA